MKLGIIGLPQSGKNTIFEALTHNFDLDTKHFRERFSTVKVSDDRIDILSNMYNPKKTVYAQVEYFLPESKKNRLQSINQNTLNQIRNCDALVNVINNFTNTSFEKSSLTKEFDLINQEMILSDAVVVEKRLERITLDKKRGKQINSKELSILEKCLDKLNKEKPLRNTIEIVDSKIIKGYAFLSAKPLLVLINNNDENDSLPNYPTIQNNPCMIIRGKLEQELAQMSYEDSRYFLKEFNISAPAINKVIAASYNLLGLISFFTVGKDEVKAWTIKANTTAINAAKIIHSDIKKGFIRAEVISYKHLIEAKNYTNAKKKGNVRLEGKNYQISDGDIINFRFNV